MSNASKNLQSCKLISANEAIQSTFKPGDLVEIRTNSPYPIRAVIEGYKRSRGISGLIVRRQYTNGSFRRWNRVIKPEDVLQNFGRSPEQPPPFSALAEDKRLD
jgi:hypothetical protein